MIGFDKGTLATRECVISESGSLWLMILEMISMARVRVTDPNADVLIQARVPLHVRDEIKAIALLDKVNYQVVVSKALVEYVKIRFPDQYSDNEQVDGDSLIESLVD